MIFTDLSISYEQTFINDKRIEILKKVKQKPKLVVVVTSEEEANPNESKRVSDYGIAEDGSLRTFLGNDVPPVRIIPDSETVKLTAVYKRILALLAGNMGTTGWLGRISTLLAVKYNLNTISQWFEYLFDMNVALLKEEYYSQPVKELRRALKGVMDANLVNALTLVIEYDSAYRYRFQDIIVLLDKSKLKGFKSIKEVGRLFDVLSEREKAQYGSGGRYDSMKKLVQLAMLSPRIRKQVIYVLKELNLNELKLSEEDTYWTNGYGKYSYRGLDWETRKQQNKLKYGV